MIARVACFFLQLLGLLCTVEASPSSPHPASEPTTADLRRAVQRKPRKEYLGRDAVHMSQVLNNHLRKLGEEKIAPCMSFNFETLSALQQRLLELRHTHFDAIYQNASDKRMLAHALTRDGTHDMASDPLILLKAKLGEEKERLARRPELWHAMRDSKCRLVVQWFVHHLHNAAREMVLQLPDFRLPLLPASTVHDLGLSDNETDTELALSDFEKSSPCQPCHIGPEPSPSFEPDPSHRGPAFVRWPDSVDYNLFAGMSSCCNSSDHFTQIRQIKRRNKAKQQLDVISFSDCQSNMKPAWLKESDCPGFGFGPDDPTCMLDDCWNGIHKEYLQYASCHFFYNGTDIWEWYPGLRQCTKLIAGTGLPAPWGLPVQFNNNRTVYRGWDTIPDAPDPTQNRSCHKWTFEDGDQSQDYWMHQDGRPCKQRFVGGVDLYGSKENGDWTEVEDDGPILTKLPDYCPPQDTPALMPSDFPSNLFVCTKFWINKTKAEVAAIVEGTRRGVNFIAV